jgi:hypothetical protein
VPRRPRPGVIAAVLACLAFAPVLPLTSTSASAAVQVSGSLAVSPSRYVAGQAVRFRGDLGPRGARAVHLQSNGNRPGDVWRDVPGSTFRTDAGGAFDFVYRAPAMYNLSYRVVGDGFATEPYRFTASPQDLTLAPLLGNPEYPYYPVVPGSTFTVVADTTPQTRSSFGSPPPIPGRTVSLQQRVDATTWRTLDSQPTDVDGNATFTVTAPSSGELVLRARQERWTTGANDVGWYASFPAYFVVPGADDVLGALSRGLSTRLGPESANRPTASQRYRWGPARFDYAWEAGQDLDSPASKGSDRTGRWEASSDGTGRVTPFNGGLVLQSKLKKVGPGDRGTTTATLLGSAQKHGRWEFRIQGRRWETGARAYRFVLELVPVGAPVTDCSPLSVVLADFTMGSPGMRFGVRSQAAGRVWQRVLPDVQLGEQPFNVAVEVGKDHLTWFRDGKPIGTVSSRATRPGVALVPRLGLYGGDEEMDAVQVNSDWQRSWTLRAGKQVTSGTALKGTRYSACS